MRTIRVTHDRQSMHLYPNLLKHLTRQGDLPSESTSTTSSFPSSAFYFGATVFFLLLVGYAIARSISFLLRRIRHTNSIDTSISTHQTSRIRHSFFEANQIHQHNPDLDRPVFLEYEPPSTPPPIHRQRFDPKDLNLKQISEAEKSQPCVICLEPHGEFPVSAGKCNHIMHTSCLTDWLKKDLYSSCPVCRQCYLDKEVVTKRGEEEYPQSDNLQDLVVPSETSRLTTQRDTTISISSNAATDTSTRNSCDIQLGSQGDVLSVS